MILIWKNKGILILVYLFVSFIGSAIIIGILKRNIGGVFNEIDFFSILGIGFLITAVWTYLTKNDYYKDNEGNKKKMDTNNEFFYIKMEYWVYIFLVSAFISFGNSLLIF